MTKKIIFTILLLSSIGLNIYLLRPIELDTKESSDLSIGLSETYELLFDQMNQFNEKYTSYKNGDIGLEEFEIHRELTYKNVGRITNILDSYNVISIEALESYMVLEDYYYSFDIMEKSIQDESLQEIQRVVRENSNLTVAMIYKNDKLLRDGNVPDEILNLSKDLNQILKELNLNYYNSSN